MYLSKINIQKIPALTGLQLPDASMFLLPEKVLQFGTGVLLRALPDFIIDKANKENRFNGRIVMVKSTAGGDTGAFDRQDGLYTVCVRGIDDGKRIEENYIISSVSRVLQALTQWDAVLEIAANPQMQVIISNTTEVGISLIKDDVFGTPPQSFPGKLLSFLHRRFIVFDGDPTRGMVVIPTELIPGNADKLLAIVKELARQNNLEISFLEWLEHANYFCNSLVDRIVPGKLSDHDHHLAGWCVGGNLNRNSFDELFARICSHVRLNFDLFAAMCFCFAECDTFQRAGIFRVGRGDGHRVRPGYRRRGQHPDRADQRHPLRPGPRHHVGRLE